jgi:hypothetical protein
MTQLRLWIGAGPGARICAVALTLEAAMEACQAAAGWPVDWVGDPDAFDDAEAGRFEGYHPTGRHAGPGVYSITPTSADLGPAEIMVLICGLFPRPDFDGIASRVSRLDSYHYDGRPESLRALDPDDRACLAAAAAKEG